MEGYDYSYELRLRALAESLENVKQVRCETDLDAVAIAAHRALDCVYDLHEAYFYPATGRGSLAEKDHHLSRVDGRVVGALAFARGGKTHELLVAARAAGYGDLPYGAGPYGGGWVWRERETKAPRACLTKLWSRR